MMGWTVEKNSASGIRVTARMLRLVRVGCPTQPAQVGERACRVGGAPGRWGWRRRWSCVLSRRDGERLLELPAASSRRCVGVVSSSSSASSSASVRWPVSDRKTSSRLGSRRLNVWGAIPSASSVRRASMAAWGPLSTVTSARVPLTRAAWGPRASRRAPVRAASSTVGRPTSRTVAPRSAFMDSGVPSAMTRPWSMTARVLARRSASSRYWVVRSTVVPRHELLDDLPQVVAALGVETGRRLVEEQDGRVGPPGRRPGRAAGACRPRTSSAAGRRRRSG